MLLVAVPGVFVTVAAEVLEEFARALGGGLAGDAASGLTAGWAAALVSAVLGMFQASSARGADRRLALAGAGAVRVASSRIGASLALAFIASVAGFATLAVRTTVTHPAHAAAAVIGFALIYLGVGVIVGCLVDGPLEGSLLVALVFILDVFSGPGMSSEAEVYSLTRPAADILLQAGIGRGSPAGDWLTLGAVTAAALLASFAAFSWTARRRT